MRSIVTALALILLTSSAFAQAPDVAKPAPASAPANRSGQAAARKPTTDYQAQVRAEAARRQARKHQKAARYSRQQAEQARQQQAQREFEARMAPVVARQQA
jgi:hypothetical protein